MNSFSWQRLFRCSMKHEPTNAFIVLHDFPARLILSQAKLFHEIGDLKVSRRMCITFGVDGVADRITRKWCKLYNSDDESLRTRLNNEGLRIVVFKVSPIKWASHTTCSLLHARNRNALWRLDCSPTDWQTDLCWGMAFVLPGCKMHWASEHSTPLSRTTLGYVNFLEVIEVQLGLIHSRKLERVCEYTL